MAHRRPFHSSPRHFVACMGALMFGVTGTASAFFLLAVPAIHGLLDPLDVGLAIAVCTHVLLLTNYGELVFTALVLYAVGTVSLLLDLPRRTALVSQLGGIVASTRWYLVFTHSIR
jgi:hypothetical protein